MPIHISKLALLRSSILFIILVMLSSCSTLRSTSTIQKDVIQKRSLLTEDKEFIWGVNGHPVTNIDYVKTNLEQDIQLLKEHHFSFYRFDIRTDQDGKVILHPDRFLELLKKSSQEGIGILPVLLINKFLDDYQILENEAFDRGYRQMKGFAERYGDYIDYYALGNEQELRFIKAGSEGIYPEDYDYDKFKILASYLKGMHQGLKEAKPEAKAIVNSAGWKHIGYYELLENEKVPYDILGYHWYSKTGSYLMELGSTRIIDMLYEKYKKPIWITEINYTRGSHDSETEQAEVVKSFIEVLPKQNYIEAFFIYELYDQPFLIDQEWAGAREANFGIVRWKDNPPIYHEYDYKPISDVLKYSIEQANNGYENFIYSLISDLTNKQPIQELVDNWVSRFDILKNSSEFIEEFYSNNDIKNYHLSIEEPYITKVYQDLLHRNPTKAEEKFWTRKIRKNPNLDIRKTIIGSEEYWEKAIWEGYNRRTENKKPQQE